LFDLLGVAPVLGRLPTDAIEDEHAVAISHAQWQARFGGAGDVLGRQFGDGAQRYTIVGVMPEHFAYPHREVDAWRPLALTGELMESARQGSVGNVGTIIRIGPEQTLAQATERINSLLDQEPALEGLRQGAGMRFVVQDLRSSLIGDRLRALWLLQGALALVLIAVLTNVANLMLERLLTRERELGVRAAMGASRARLLASASVESLLLLGLGLLLGLLLAPMGLQLILNMGLIEARQPFQYGAWRDLLGAGLALGVVAALVLGLVPLTMVATRAALHRLTHGLRTRHEARSTGRVRAVLVVAQLAITTLLLIGAGLFGRSLYNVLSEDAGFDRRAAVMAMLALREGESEGAVLTPVELNALRAEIAALPGVRGVAYADMAPMTLSDSSSNFGLRDDADKMDRTARTVYISDGYFEALGIRLREGRDFAVSDTGGSPVSVVDGYFARTFFDQRSPVGERLRVGQQEGGALQTQIVGVVDSVRHRSLDETIDRPTIYLPFRANARVVFAVRTDTEPAALVGPLRALLGQRMPQAEIETLAPLSEMARQTVGERESLLRLIGLFALVAAAITMLGLYALMAVTVRRRAAEIGVRQALGADAARISRWVLSRGLRVALLGVTIGALGGALMGGRIAGQLYRVNPYDPWILVGVAVFALVLALLASAVPARRAARLPPATCLRAD
jgi:predicted permease